MSGEWLHIMDDSGMTPLDRIFGSGHIALAEMLLRHEKHDQAENLRGVTPLHRAAHLGLDDAVRSLLSCGTDVDRVDASGESALHKAAIEGHVEIVDLLADLCDVNERSNDGMTPLHLACLNGNPAVVELLMNHGADARMRNEIMDGLTPMDLADIMGHTELEAALSVNDSFV